MPATADNQKRPTLSADDLLGGGVYDAANLNPAPELTGLDREVARLIADDRRAQLTEEDHPLPGW